MLELRRWRLLSSGDGAQLRLGAALGRFAVGGRLAVAALSLTALGRWGAWAQRFVSSPKAFPAVLPLRLLSARAFSALMHWSALGGAAVRCCGDPHFGRGGAQLRLGACPGCPWLRPGATMWSSSAVVERLWWRGCCAVAEQLFCSGGWRMGAWAHETPPPEWWTGPPLCGDLVTTAGMLLAAVCARGVVLEGWRCGAAPGRD